MDCAHFDAGRCRSCTWLPRPYDSQVVAKQDDCARLLAGHTALTWLDPAPSRETNFRNKAKMVVTGTSDMPVLGILGESRQGVDLSDCGLHVPAVRDALPVLAEFVTRAGLVPYDLDTRRGELKHLIVTASPDDELMVRFVSRSQEPVARIRKHLPWLAEHLPSLRVATVNLQPEHKAVLEGEREIVLTEESSLLMRVNGLDLHLRPQSFFQTNTDVAAALYRQGRDWIRESDPASLWDLYCGVGGFALHAADGHREVTGIELGDEAVTAARQSASEAGLRRIEFVAGDATEYALRSNEPPAMVSVNPPRRGIGTALAGWIEHSGVHDVLYSSCNPVTLTRDLAAMPSLAPVKGRLFDMFPHTSHSEVLVLLRRQDLSAG